MNEPTLKSSIIEYARNRSDEWINGGVFEKLANDLHFKGSNASRRCREIVKSGLFERRLNENRCVEYKFKGFQAYETPKELKILSLI